MSIRLVILVAALAVGLVLWARVRRAASGSPRLPRNRVLHMRIRLHLRLRPGPGHASLLQLWLRWGRFAAFRESGRIRPSLPSWYRLRHPWTHSLFLGRAQLRHGLRVSAQEHGCVIGPPRSFKSALMAKTVLNAPGAVVTTSSKPDVFRLTAGPRSLRGPIWVFNPMHIGKIPSNVAWSPLEGCVNPSTAIRRADQFASAASTSGAEDAKFWADKASDALRGLFMSAAASGAEIDQVNEWVNAMDGSAQITAAASILNRAGFPRWAGQLAELTGPAEKTAATVRMVMSRALGWLNDPEVAAAALPGNGPGFDIDEFLLSGGTLYCLAKVPDGGDSVVAPLFAALISEIEYRATQLGAATPGGRLDPPLLLELDEVTQIAPVPLPSWLADAGGQGVSIWSGFHGVAQLKERWKDNGAQTVLDTSSVTVYTPGIKDTGTLQAASQLSGHAAYREGGEEKDSRHEVLTPDMVRQLPAAFALAIRGAHSPVIFKIAKAWKDRGYRRWKRYAHHHGVTAESMVIPRAVYMARSRLAEALPVPVPAGDLAWPEPEMEPAGFAAAPVDEATAAGYPWGSQ